MNVGKKRLFGDIIAGIVVLLGSRVPRLVH